MAETAMTDRPEMVISLRFHIRFLHGEGPQGDAAIPSILRGRKGFLMYERMPFRLTGAPTTFGELMAREMGDLVGSLFQLFVNDGGMAADNFEQHIADMRTLFNRVQERKLSLSMAKSLFFMTEVTFAGSTVGPDGVNQT